MTPTILRPIEPTANRLSQYVITTSLTEPAHASTIVVEVRGWEHQRTYLHPQEALKSRPEWAEKEFRQGYMEASIEEGLAWQIRANREHRGVTQQALGEAIGTSQAGISRFEDPEYGKHSLDTLVKIANAFDCALSVRFVPYSQLALESEDLSPEALYATPFEVEAKFTRIDSGYQY
uniref:helix-turn-helix domain-containing protein n=1 Tax=Caballeronia sp. LjRoot34 TaxID=3342325 RepID=UPI003F504A12